jgi:hypothetical protein
MRCESPPDLSGTPRLAHQLVRAREKVGEVVESQDVLRRIERRGSGEHVEKRQTCGRVVGVGVGCTGTCFTRQTQVHGLLAHVSLIVAGVVRLIPRVNIGALFEPVTHVGLRRSVAGDAALHTQLVQGRCDNGARKIGRHQLREQLPLVTLGCRTFARCQIHLPRVAHCGAFPHKQPPLGRSLRGQVGDAWHGRCRCRCRCRCEHVLFFFLVIRRLGRGRR